MRLNLKVLTGAAVLAGLKEDRLCLSDKLQLAAQAARLAADDRSGRHRADLLCCADAFDGAARDARDLERDLVTPPTETKPHRFRGHHLRRRFRGDRPRRDEA